VSTAPGWDPTVGRMSGTFAWQGRFFSGMEAEQIVRPFPSVDGIIRFAGWTE